MSKKDIIICVVIGVFLSIVSSVVYAQEEQQVRESDPTIEKTAEAFDAYEQGNVSAPITVREFEHDKIVIYLCWLGLDGACTSKVKVGEETPYYHENSVLGYLNKGIVSLYLNKPADVSTYLADLGQRAGIIKPAYAQGIGFSALSPLLDLHRAFRNIAYGFLIVVLIIIGFMILFRMKIDPRTVISIQNALPRIITTLVLITFSYAIAGLLIDLMYLAIFLIIITLRTSTMDTAGVFVNYSGGLLSNLYSAVFAPGWGAVDDIVNIIGGGTLRNVTTLVGTLIGGILGGPIPIIGNIGGGAIGAAAGRAAPNVIVWLIVMLALLFALIRIFITLLKAYINIILSIIFGPLQIAIGAIPNTNTFSSWFRGIVANLSVFPVTTALLYIGTLLNSDITNKTQQLWAPPGLQGSVKHGVAGIIGLGIVLAIPSVADAIKEALKAKPFVPATPGALLSPLGTIYGAGMQALSAQYYLSEATPVGRLIGKLRKK